jgi:hypothetical protein
MNATKRLSGFCTECGGSVEFRADLIGTMAACPRCGKQTELMLAAPKQESGLPRKVIAYTAAAVVILVVGLGAALVVLKHFEKLAAQQRDRAAAAPGAEAAAAAAGLSVSGIAVEKGQGSNQVSVVATVINDSPALRGQVGLEFHVLDAGGKVVGVARAFRPALEAGAKWDVKVAVEGAQGAVSAKLASIREGPSGK